MDQQPVELKTEPAKIHSQRHKKIIVLMIVILLLLIGGATSIYLVVKNSENEITDNGQLTPAERYIYDGNNAVYDQDKLKAYNQAKKLLYEQGNYERVVSMYESAYKKADTASRYYAYYLYYLADAYFKNGQLDPAVEMQQKFVSTYQNTTYIRPVPRDSAKKQLAYLQQVQKTSSNNDQNKPLNSVN